MGMAKYLLFIHPLIKIIFLANPNHIYPQVTILLLGLKNRQNRIFLWN